MDFLDMVPDDDEQAVAIGQNGTGKSNWLKIVVVPYRFKRQIIVIDAKHDDIWDGFGVIVNTPEKLFKLADKFDDNPVLVYRPSGELADDYDAYDDIFSWVYDRWYTVLVVDEATKVIEFPGKLRKGLSDICTRGRKRHILRLFGTQRPTGTPRIIFSEAKRFYIKDVIDDRDREIMSKFAGPSARLPIPDQFGMRYINTALKQSIYFPQVPYIK